MSGRRRVEFFLFIACFYFVGVFSLNVARAAGADAAAVASTVAAVSCDCPKLKCSPCEIETGTSFYAEKCGGEGQGKTRSCQKPSCEPVKDVKACMVRHGLKAPDELVAMKVNDEDESHGAELKNAVEPTKVADPLAKAADAAAAGKASTSESADTAPAPTTEYVGKIVFSAGTANIVRVAGNVEKAKPNAQVYEGDSLETGESGKIKFIFVDMNELNVTPNSLTKIEMQRYDAKKDARKTLLNLVYGRIRSKVKQKYDGQASTFEIRTKSSVAGVRGTDFVASFILDDKRWISEVQTISGAVELNAEGRKDGGVQIPAGSYASLTVKNPPRGPASETQVREAIKHGQMSRVYQMKLEDLKALDKNTDFDAESEALLRESAAAHSASDGVGDRSPASQDTHVCTTPAAKFNQCSFTCEGMGAGATSCEKGIKGVSCVRRRCDAAGKWVDPQPVNSSECRINTSVKDCGAYW